MEEIQQKEPNLATRPNGLDQKEVNQGLENLSVVVEEVKSYEGDDMIGGNWTFIAVKNLTSYMIGTLMKGIKVIENEAEIYSRMLPVEENWLLKDIAYIEHLDCYVYLYRRQLYRKDIDDKLPYVIMKNINGIRMSNIFQYSKLNRRLFLNNDNKSIFVINLERNQIEMEIGKIRLTSNHYMNPFRLFGRHENQFIAVTISCSVLLFTINFKQKKICSSRGFQINMIEKQREHGQSVAVSEDNRHALVQVAKEDLLGLSRMLVFNIKAGWLTLKAVIDQDSEEVPYMFAFDGCGSIGSHTLWVRMSYQDKVISVFDFCEKTQELKELEEKRATFDQTRVVELRRVGDQIWYVGNQGRIMRLSINF